MLLEDEDADSMTWREVRARFCGRRSKEAMMTKAPGAQMLKVVLLSVTYHGGEVRSSENAKERREGDGEGAEMHDEVDAAAKLTSEPLPLR